MRREGEGESWESLEIFHGLFAVNTFQKLSSTFRSVMYPTNSKYSIHQGHVYFLSLIQMHKKTKIISA